MLTSSDTLDAAPKVFYSNLGSVRTICFGPPECVLWHLQTHFGPQDQEVLGDSLPDSRRGKNYRKTTALQWRVVYLFGDCPDVNLFRIPQLIKIYPLEKPKFRPWLELILRVFSLKGRHLTTLSFFCEWTIQGRKKPWQPQTWQDLTRFSPLDFSPLSPDFRGLVLLNCT